MQITPVYGDYTRSSAVCMRRISHMRVVHTYAVEARVRARAFATIKRWTPWLWRYRSPTGLHWWAPMRASSRTHELRAVYVITRRPANPPAITHENGRKRYHFYRNNRPSVWNDIIFIWTMVGRSGISIIVFRHRQRAREGGKRNQIIPLWAASPRWADSFPTRGPLYGLQFRGLVGLWIRAWWSGGVIVRKLDRARMRVCDYLCQNPVSTSESNPAKAKGSPSCDLLSDTSISLSCQCFIPKLEV